MIGGIVLDTDFGQVVGFENHSGATVLGSGQAALGRSGRATATTGRTEPREPSPATSSAPYLHGPLLPRTPAGRPPHRAGGGAATGRPFEPATSTTRWPTRPGRGKHAVSSRHRAMGVREYAALVALLDEVYEATITVVSGLDDRRRSGGAKRARRASGTSREAALPPDVRRAAGLVVPCPPRHL